MHADSKTTKQKPGTPIFYGQKPGLDSGTSSIGFVTRHGNLLPCDLLALSK